MVGILDMLVVAQDEGPDGAGRSWIPLGSSWGNGKGAWRKGRIGTPGYPALRGYGFGPGCPALGLHIVRCYTITPPSGLDFSFPDSSNVALTPLFYPFLSVSLSAFSLSLSVFPPYCFNLFN